MTAPTPTLAEQIAAVTLICDALRPVAYGQAALYADGAEPLMKALDCIQCGLEAHAAAASALGWRDITSAPRDDGFEADLWCVHPEHQPQRSANMQWDADHNRWLDWMGMPLNPGWQPTHWMVLPEGPPPEQAL